MSTGTYRTSYQALVALHFSPTRHTPKKHESTKPQASIPAPSIQFIPFCSIKQSISHPSFHPSYPHTYPLRHRTHPLVDTRHSTFDIRQPAFDPLGFDRDINKFVGGAPSPCPSQPARPRLRGRPRASLSPLSYRSSTHFDSNQTPVLSPRLLAAAKRRQLWTRNDRTMSRLRRCRRAFNRRAVKQRV